MLFDVNAAAITPVDASLHSEAEQPVGYSQTFLALYLQSGGCNNPQVESNAMPGIVGSTIFVHV